MTTKQKTFASIAVLATAMFALSLASSADAQLVSELGILDLDANGGINPATGFAWEAGDQYRLTFVTSTTRDATSTDINVYNDFVQGVAGSSTTFSNLGDATWKVIGSTEAVNARVNTGTTGTGGVSTFLMDGATLFATDNGDLWNGTANEGGGVFAAPDLDENGSFLSAQVFTGTTGGGATVADRWFGTTTISNGQLRVTRGLTQPNNPNRWMQQFNNNPNSSLSFYALSDPLTVQAAPVPEPASIAIWSLLGLGLAGFGYYRVRRKK
mgnify:CR=1 FL=1